MSSPAIFGIPCVRCKEREGLYTVRHDGGLEQWCVDCIVRDEVETALRLTVRGCRKCGLPLSRNEARLVRTEDAVLAVHAGCEKREDRPVVLEP